MIFTTCQKIALFNKHSRIQKESSTSTKEAFLPLSAENIVRFQKIRAVYALAYTCAAVEIATTTGIHKLKQVKLCSCFLMKIA